MAEGEREAIKHLSRGLEKKITKERRESGGVRRVHSPLQGGGGEKESRNVEKRRSSEGRGFGKGRTEGNLAISTEDRPLHKKGKKKKGGQGRLQFELEEQNYEGVEGGGV